MGFGEILVHAMTVLQLHYRNSVVPLSMENGYICSLFFSGNKLQIYSSRFKIHEADYGSATT
jgi:hypothetical protein